MSLGLIVDPENDQINVGAFQQQTEREKKLVSYVMGYVDDWKDYRDSNFRDDWNTYYRMWKGIWHAADKTRNSERSKLISPALSQAIEMQVSELEDATFNRKNWFDIADDIADEDKAEMEALRDRLLEDMERTKVPSNVVEVYLNSSIYGTGIGKIVVEEKTDKKLDARGDVVESDKVDVSLVAISPDEFVCDPSAKDIESALGCAHDTILPRHLVEAKKKAGVYYNKDLGTFSDDLDVSVKGESKDKAVGDKTRITEWHGLVPVALLEEEEDFNLEEGEEIVELFPTNKEDVYEDDLVEAIVTIANGSILLRDVENPFIFKDRSIIAYQHDRVPNRFWGRGVAEKGINVQRALDAELRGRIDGLALTIHPMMAIDATRLPRGINPEVGPGKTILTSGNPKEILNPLNFGNINSQTFAQGGELERMIQMATGSMDTATSTNNNPRNNTASGMSMMQTSMIKRTKRTMQNIARDFLEPMIRKIAWRYMQFNNDRYPIDDYKFVPITTMGMMAREFETAQLTSMLNMTAPESPLFGLIVSQIIENGSGENKEEFKEAIKQMYAPKPPDPLMEEVKKLEVQKLKMEILEIQTRSGMNIANAEAREQDADTNEFNAETKRLDVEGKIQDNELDRQNNKDKGNK